MNRYCINNYRRSLLVFLWIALYPLTLDARMLFNSERLKQIYGLLSDDYKISIQEKSTKPGTYFLNFSFKGDKHRLVFRINNYKELDHIGICLVNDSLIFQPVREVYDYLEREFLVSALLGEKYPLMSEAGKEKIGLFYNGSLLARKQKNAPKISIDQNTPLRLKQNHDFFAVEWTLQSSDKFKVIIPNNYSLITEKTKDELENDLLRKLKYSGTSQSVTARPLRSQLKPYDLRVYLLEGEIFASTPELSSSTFFEIRDSIYPVYNRKYYRESVRNLFLNMISTTIMLDITQNLYGGHKEKFRININDFYGNFSQDYTVYFGWQNIEGENLKASIIISSTLFNFSHLLVVTMSSNAIFDNTGKIEGMFYAYIPKEKLNSSIH